MCRRHRRNRSSCTCRSTRPTRRCRRKRRISRATRARTTPAGTSFARRESSVSARWTCMDLGLKGRRALVCAASKGLGRGCAEALASEGVDVTICARTAFDVERAAAEIGARARRPVAWVACDIATVEGRAAALDACPQPDILVNNAGGPPRGDFRDWDRVAWLRALDANMTLVRPSLHKTNGRRVTAVVCAAARPTLTSSQVPSLHRLPSSRRRSPWLQRPSTHRRPYSRRPSSHRLPSRRHPLLHRPRTW